MSAAKEYKTVHGGYPDTEPAGGEFVVRYAKGGETTVIGNTHGLRFRYGIVDGHRCVVFYNRADAEEFAARRNSPRCMYFDPTDTLVVRKLGE